ncbi:MULTISPECIES: ankyrin repeat domain-containing protein [Streptomyces]|uniref:Ankyrin repeat domain-containing protein n=1 Tax=Streptomyces koelreuteriae TaxID=2838015 RepID=A0ABX8FXL7_9ACTN|nr:MULTISPECIES: ankyrin repeat domain-containing protein [Streptomyces]QWB25792.1 ankyrin repeat domain-containing protein [Streptomyces koelreuteriae]UUA08850.1 ankyrin repeat domain-containing protein [Streptomyces koelreuteriae]UUA16455.1 ankyrin repeat domain-containing protein [Streptomyces sp. CRCS-T-1]
MAERWGGWPGKGSGWTDVEDIRRRLDGGADPDEWRGGRPLHRAAVFGSAEVVAELAGHAADVDALEEGVTALWEAVMSRKPENARALAAAGADPWRPSIGGWSPGRLSLAGPTPDLFPIPEGVRLTDTERAAAQEGRRLTTALGEFHYDGTGLACVAGIDAAEAVRRLGATPVADEVIDELLEDPYAYDMDASLQIIGVTSVPGGCVVTQPWGYAPEMPGVLTRLSAGTVCYGLYANPKSGNQGSIVRQGIVEGSDLHPGGGPYENDSSEEVLASYLYQHNAVAYSCAFAGLRLPDRRAVCGPPDAWVELPRRGYWRH